MKRLQILRNLGLGLPQFAEGQIVEAEDELGQRLIGMALAVELQAIPPAVGITVVTPVEDSPASPEPVVETSDKTRRQPGAKRSKKS